jgi:hypothetical protein
MFKKAFLYTALSLTYAIGMSLKLVGNGFLSVAEKIILVLDKKKAE